MTAAVVTLLASVGMFGAGLAIAEEARRLTARAGGFALMAAGLIAFVLVFAAVA